MNFTQMNASDNNLVYACETDENLEWFEKLSYWTEGVFQLGLGNNQRPCISGVTSLKLVTQTHHFQTHHTKNIQLCLVLNF